MYKPRRQSKKENVLLHMNYKRIYLFKARINLEL
jgi:hypothetical protein